MVQMCPLVRCLFQFQKVRLKVELGGRFYSDTYLFQFQKVRLKAR